MRHRFTLTLYDDINTDAELADYLLSLPTNRRAEEIRRMVNIGFNHQNNVYPDTQVVNPTVNQYQPNYSSNRARHESEPTNARPRPERNQALTNNSITDSSSYSGLAPQVLAQGEYFSESESSRVKEAEVKGNEPEVIEPEVIEPEVIEPDQDQSPTDESNEADSGINANSEEGIEEPKNSDVSHLDGLGQFKQLFDGID